MCSSAPKDRPLCFMNDNENKEKKPRIFTRLNIILFMPLIVAAALFVISHSDLFSGTPSITVSSYLEKMKAVQELSTAQFTYNGIAQIYKDGKKEKPECSIRYSAVVKAGIDMNDFKLEADEETKQLTASLPEIKILTNVVNEKSISFIPENAGIDLKTALTACEDDILQEVQASHDLFDTAEDNLKGTIEAMLLPLISDSGYTLVWE